MAGPVTKLLSRKETTRRVLGGAVVLDGVTFYTSLLEHADSRQNGPAEVIFAAEGKGIVAGAGGDGLSFIGVEPEVLDLVPELGGVAGVDDDGKAGGKDIVDA